VIIVQQHHPMLPDEQNGELARENFMQALKSHRAKGVSPGVTELYERRVAPQWESDNGTLPCLDAIPDAEMHAIELGAPMLGHGHARAEASGMPSPASARRLMIHADFPGYGGLDPLCPSR